ncbi:MAG: adenosylmethionine decarboxylase [Deltaproteobacteria bacterium]|jgi:S-adenosylmethionine decarboxylase proenzyme|nr:adenosylmethionine decarboxylase [Deltaproteobacteria bacterium]
MSTPPTPPAPPPPLGWHHLVELYGCEVAALDDLPRVEAALIAAAKAAGATVLDVRFHKFAPQGVSGVVLIAESHLSVHTWPEHAYAAVDLFTCGATLDAEPAVALLQAALRATTVSRQAIPRGRALIPPRPAA